MPNRIIKESICISESISQLSSFEETMFYRLIVNCDDYGRFDGRIAVLKNRLFPLKDGVTTELVKKSLRKLESCKMVNVYEVNGKPYVEIPTWEEHQCIRAKKSKYPPRSNAENDCTQLNANAPVIQSNPNPNPNPNPYPYPNPNPNTNTITTTTTDYCTHAPGLHEVHEYFKRNGCFDRDVDYTVEAVKFIAYNANRGWDCLPDWHTTADLWAVRDNDR